MQRGTIQLDNYGLIEDYRNTFNKWSALIIGTPAVVILDFLLYIYYRLQLSVNPTYEPMIGIRWLPLLIPAGIIFLLLISLLTRPGRVTTFQEGIYVHPGFTVGNDPARRPTFMAWNEITRIIRTPYRGMGMSIVGIEPVHEVILPGSLSKRFDEIQEQIMQMQTRGRIELLDLSDPNRFALAQFGTAWQDLYGIAPFVALVVPVFRVFIADVKTYIRLPEAMAGRMGWLPLLIPIFSGSVVAAVGVLVFWMFRKGFFMARVLVYRDGILTLGRGQAAFTRWDELTSIERGRGGVFTFHHADPKVRAYSWNIGKSRADEFERILKRLGKLVG